MFSGKSLYLLEPNSAFHAGDRGSNPLGDAKEIQRVRVHSLARCCYLVAPHGSPQVAVDILNVPLRCGDILVSQDPLNGLGTDLMRICQQ